MNTFLRVLLLAGLLTPELAVAEDSWLTIYRSETGYLFQGQGAANPWSFDVPGTDIRTTNDQGRAFASIDKILVQIMRVPITDFPEGDALAEHHRQEIAYLKQIGTQIVASDQCADLSVAHREWLATMPGASTSAYLTLELVQDILVIAVANEGEQLSAQAIEKLKGLCASMTVSG